MPRGPRNYDAAGGVYHVGTRGNNRQRVFHDRRDYRTFREIMKQAARNYGCKFYHYSLIPNHYHFEVAVRPPFLLPDIMKWINQQYSWYHRRRYNRTGHLWGSRYWSKDAQGYWLTAAFYVEYNAVSHGLVTVPEEHEWSSYRFYANGKPDDVVSVDPVYLTMGATDDERRKRYTFEAAMWFEVKLAREREHSLAL